MTTLYLVRGRKDDDEWIDGHSFTSLADAERHQAERYALNDGADYVIEVQPPRIRLMRGVG